MKSPIIRLLSVLALAGAASAVTLVAAPQPAAADGPGVGPGWVVTVGDSYISGEAGRWAGNTNGSSGVIDALGGTAYFDNASNTGESINRCHRSKSAEAYIGTLSGYNLACSGARSATFTDPSGYFKPGLDFYDANGKQGQAAMLQSFASSHNVRLVVVSVGGNNFNFAGIIQSCVQDFLLSPSWAKDYCNDDSSVTANFTPANIATQRAAIKTGLLNVRTAMRNAGYADSAWTLVVQNYPSPVPAGAGFRYSQSGYTRQNTGGCGFWNADADWANGSALATINSTVAGALSDSGISNARSLDLTAAFQGRRLCESSVGLYEERGLTSWTQTGAVDQTEWVNQIRTVSTATSSYYVQESLHPNYWGQLALRSCLRQAWNNGVPRSGACTVAGTGLVAGEPRMSLG